MLLTFLDLLSKTAVFCLLLSIIYYIITGIFYIGEKTRHIYVFCIPLSDIISLVLGVLIIINFFEISSPYK